MAQQTQGIMDAYAFVVWAMRRFWHTDGRCANTQMPSWLDNRQTEVSILWG